MSRRALVLSTAAVALLAVACVPAKRSGPQLRTAIFACTGGAQTWTVPAGVTQAYFEAYGAQGGAGAGTTSSPGGKGGEATITMAVTPGETIQVDVGCAGKNGVGTTGGGGGFGGGGDGGGALDSAGGGGGGASDVRRGATALLVAGGGGGGGASDNGMAATGGTGGGANGGNGLSANLGGHEGEGATPTMGGDGGACQIMSCDGVNGSSGTGGAGGGGGPAHYGGGGGGGGSFGGGGGGGDNNPPNSGAGGGGGGSGSGPADTSFLTGVQAGDGTVAIFYTA